MQTLEANAGSYFSRTIFQPLPEETAKYHCCFISQYSTCTLQDDNFVRIIFAVRLSGGWQYSQANKSNTVTAKEDVKQTFSCCNVIWALISWFLWRSNFYESKTSHSHSKNKWWRTQVVIILSEKEKKLDAAAPEFILIFIFAETISFGSWQVTRWGKHLYLVSSGRAWNYVVYDVLLNFLKRSTDFSVPMELHRYFGFLYFGAVFTEKKWGIY